METFDPKAVPPERWAGALAIALLSQMPPDALFDLVTEGEAKFVRMCVQFDAMGLKKDHYRECFKKLRRKAIQMGWSK